MATRTPKTTEASPAPTKPAAKRSAPKNVAKAAPATSKTKAKPAVAKSAAAKPVALKPVAAKKVAAPAKNATTTVMKASTAPHPTLTTEQRNHYVSVAAFYIAERRGFTLGNPQEDWLQAEAEIDRLIASGHFSF